MGFSHPNLKKFSTVIVRLVFLLALKSPNGSKAKDIKLSKLYFGSGNGLMTAFTLIVSLIGFSTIYLKVFLTGFKSRLTDWLFADKSSWGEGFKISLSFDTNLIK